MKILTAQQIREADAYTIQHEPVSSIDLMEMNFRQRPGSPAVVARETMAVTDWPWLDCLATDNTTRMFL